MLLLCWCLEASVFLFFLLSGLLNKGAANKKEKKVCWLTSHSNAFEILRLHVSESEANYFKSAIAFVLLFHPLYTHS